MLEPAEIKRWERLTAAMLNHAANDDPEAFAQVVAILAQATAKLPQVAAELRGTLDSRPASFDAAYSWAEIAAPLGITRQAAQQRYGIKSPRG